jgi:hypothetical protein
MAIEEVKETSIEDDIMAAMEMADEPISEDDADLHNDATESTEDGAVASEPVQDDSEQHTDEVATEEATTEEVEESFTAPDYWDDETKTAFEGLPDNATKDAFKQKLVNLEKGYQKKFDNIADVSKEHEQIVGLMSPFEATLNSQGLSRIQGIQRLVGAEQLLSQNPVNGLSQLVQQYGGQNAQAIVQQLAKTYGVTTEAGNSQAAEDPDPLATLQQQNSQIMAKLQQNENDAYTHRTNEARTQISDFAQAKDDSGKNLHPHFDKVERVMGQMISTGMAKDMSDAYDRAVYSDPELRQEYIANERENVAVKLNTQRKTGNQNSKVASKNVKTNNVAPENAVGEPDNVLASVQKAMRESM